MARRCPSLLVFVAVSLAGQALAADPAPATPAPAPAPAPAAAPAPAPAAYPPGYPQGYPVYTYPPGYGQVPAGYPQPAPYVAPPAPVEPAPTPLPPTCKAVVFGTPKEVEKVMGELYATGRTQFAFFGNGVVCAWK